MKGNIVLGTLAMLGLVGAMGYVAVTEVDRMETAERAYDSRAIEAGALEYEGRCRTCHGPQGKGTPLAPALNAADLFDGTRVAAAGYTGTVPDYIRGVIAAGRPVPSAGTSYPQRMPTWGEEFGGPLRSDQVNSLVAFIMNWEDRALAEAAGPPGLPPGEAVGNDITVALPAGDAERGRALSEGTLACSACHILSNAGPAWSDADGPPALAARAEARLGEAGYNGEALTAEQYLLESIVNPGTYVVSGFAPNLMPGNFGGRLTPQDAADLIAYMLTFR